ncbi:MAG: hypothetical protein IKE23_01475 [Exiguobacterium sp.]|nr:hypothetical protein [Exiguobacterium sp.]
MATNQLLPFANGAGANVETFANWSALAQVATGFGSGLAVSKYFNYILAQGGAAGYAIGKVIVDWLDEDATIDATTLGTNFEAALNAKFGGYLPLTGGTMSGNILSSASSFSIAGGTTLNYSPRVTFTSPTASTNAGNFSLTAATSSASSSLVGTPSGSLQWKGYEVFTTVNWNNVTTLTSVKTGTFTYTAPTTGVYFFDGRSSGSWSGVQFIINSSAWTIDKFQSKESSVTTIIPLIAGDVLSVVFNGATFAEVRHYFAPYKTL